MWFLAPHACIQLKTWQRVLLLFIECSFKIFCGAAYDVTGLMFLSFHMPNLAKVSIKPFFFCFLCLSLVFCLILFLVFCTGCICCVLYLQKGYYVKVFCISFFFTFNTELFTKDYIVFTFLTSLWTIPASKCHVQVTIILWKVIFFRTFNTPSHYYFVTFSTKIFFALAHDMSLVSFFTPWKYKKTFGFLIFLGSIERD